MTGIPAIQMTLPPGLSAGGGMVSVYIGGHKIFDFKSGARYG
jgi:hypothetical protein